MIKFSIPLILFLVIIPEFQMGIQNKKEFKNELSKDENSAISELLPFFPNHLISDSSSIYYQSDTNIPINENIMFGKSYSFAEGIFTFRGGPYRDKASIGFLNNIPTDINIEWIFKTKFDTSADKKGVVWGGGSGWTGQPCLINWTQKQKLGFDSLHKEYKEQKNFQEIIIGSLCGKVYFIDLLTGKATRTAINVKNPVKGSVSVDPGGKPFLYVGQGIPKKQNCGFSIIDLNNHQTLYFQSGRDQFAPRTWTAFDSSPLIDFKTGLLFWPGENGIFYRLQVNDNKIISFTNTSRFSYYTPKSSRFGMESSMAACKNLGYLTDNDGNIVCLDLQNLQPVWTKFLYDDIDASPVIEYCNGEPFVYIGNEIDKQGDKGYCYFTKINGLSGKSVWTRKFLCYSVRGKRPVNGGMLATPIVGKHKAKDLIVISLARYQSKSKGSLVAINKTTGKIVFTCQMQNFSWSSPLDVYDKEGNMYIFTADAGGVVYLFNGNSGDLICSKKIGVTFEASPVAWDMRVVLAAKGQNIYCFSIK